jgi:hypothetical protein
VHLPETKESQGDWLGHLTVEKKNFGVCGELWWIFGFGGIVVRLRWHLPAIFRNGFCEQNVVRLW